MRQLTAICLPQALGRTAPKSLSSAECWCGLRNWRRGDTCLVGIQFGPSESSLQFRDSLPRGQKVDEKPRPIVVVGRGFKLHQFFSQHV
jgi:hypothetical protein